MPKSDKNKESDLNHREKVDFANEIMHKFEYNKLGFKKILHKKSE